MRLASVRICVDDVEKAAAFYQDVVGLPRSGTAPTAILFGHSPTILVEQADDEARREGLLGRWTGLGFATDDVAALYADLEARGVPLHGPPEKQYWGGILLFAQDPSGNTISFVQFPAKSSSSEDR